jgi:hypothetical protein
VECVAIEQHPPGLAAMSSRRDATIEELLEVIAALDRRMPQDARPGEPAIARDASSLKCRALRSIAALQGPDPAPCGQQS